MSSTVPFRWIAEAEARSVREMARVQAAEAHVLGDAVPGGDARPGWLGRFAKLVPGVVWGPATALDRHRTLVAILITDIVESTRMVAEIGDRRWRGLLERHDDATRRQVRRFGGKEINNRGDGFLVMFDSPARAVRCAAAIAKALAPLGIAIRSGVHVGEVHVKCAETSGIAIHVAARIMAIARPGEACVSKTVRDLVAGSELVFEDRGVHQLRGLPEEVHLYAFADAAPPESSRRGDECRPPRQSA